MSPIPQLLIPDRVRLDSNVPELHNLDDSDVLQDHLKESLLLLHHEPDHLTTEEEEELQDTDVRLTAAEDHLIDNKNTETRALDRYC